MSNEYEYVSIRLKGVLQSWGDDSKSKTSGLRRNTNVRPTISGVHGLMMCCLGIKYGTGEQDQYNKSVKFLCVISFKDRYDILDDYQTIGGGYDIDDDFQKNLLPMKIDGKKRTRMHGYAVLTNREYIVNGDFFVILKVTTEYKEKLIDGLNNPEWVPTLGRSCCIPSVRLFVGCFDAVDKNIENIKEILSSEKGIKVDSLYSYSVEMREDVSNDVSVIYDLPIPNKKYSNSSRKEYKVKV